MLTWIALLALAAVARPAPLPPQRASAQALESWAELHAGYEKALADWKLAVDETADKALRRELRKAHPTIAWWGRFEAAAAAGEGRALLWMGENVRDKRVSRDEAVEVKERAYSELGAKHATAPWFGEVLERLPSEKKYLSSGTFTGVYQAAIERSEIADVRASAMLGLGTALYASEDEAQRAAGLAWLKRVQEEFPGTPWAAKALGATIRPEDLQPGKLAPDFGAATIDGHAFKLSDYRGKVVMLDFYGFW
jgi:hypothetical protein